MYKDPEKAREYRRKYYQEHKKQESARQRKYSKEWYQENKEVILAKQKEYYKRTREKQKEYRKKNYQEHKEQRLQYSKEYSKTHPELVGKIGARYQKRVNDESRLTAHNHYQKWTPDEIEILKRMVKQGYSYNDIAVYLGRTVKSICSKLTKMRKNGDPFNGNPVDI